LLFNNLNNFLLKKVLTFINSAKKNWLALKSGLKKINCNPLASGLS